MSTFNIALKVNRAISGATTVNANCYAIVTYAMKAATADGVNGLTTYQNGDYGYEKVITRHFGPAQAIPLTFDVKIGSQGVLPANTSPSFVRYEILSGVELANTL